MAQQKQQNQKKKKGAPMRAISGAARAKHYFDNSDRLVERKLRRILKSNGPAAAARYAKEHGIAWTMLSIAKKPTKIGELARLAINT